MSLPIGLTNVLLSCAPYAQFSRRRHVSTVFEVVDVNWP